MDTRGTEKKRRFWSGTAIAEMRVSIENGDEKKDIVENTVKLASIVEETYDGNLYKSIIKKLTQGAYSREVNILGEAVLSLLTGKPHIGISTMLSTMSDDAEYEGELFKADLSSFDKEITVLPSDQISMLLNKEGLNTTIDLLDRFRYL